VHYLQELIRKIGGMDVTLDRLFHDFSQGDNLNLSQLNELCIYVQLGLNKIQLKKLFNYLDKEKRGVILMGEMLEGV
jgi:hypothetical protein